MPNTRVPVLAALGQHLPSIGLFAVLACAWSYPLVLHLSTGVPGAGAGDNITFLWNVWWMRHALASSADQFFFTRYLFAPGGVDLTLHTHTALLDLVGATVLGRIPLVPAFNLLVIGSLFLNAAAAYLLAYQLTRDRVAAMVAGVVFGGSPYVMAHLHGHLNLVAAWGLPLFATCLFRALRDRSRAWSATAGALLACIAYTDYYYLVYAAVFGLVYVAGAWFGWSVSWRSRRSLNSWPAWIVLGFLAFDLAVAATIALTGGWVIPLAGRAHLSMTRPTNALTAAWLLLAVLVGITRAPAVRVKRERGSVRDLALLLAPLAIVALVCALPLAVHGVALWRAGDYASSTYLWRSSSPGVDLLALVAGNPFHPIWGSAVRGLFARWGTDVIEGVAWLGVVPLLLLAGTLVDAWASGAQASEDAHSTTISTAARRSARTDAGERQWWVMAGGFLLWALGPFLVCGGVNTGLFLPAFVLRYVPLVANARIPGRAMVVVYLAVAVLVAQALARSRAGSVRRTVVASLVAGVIALDFLAAPFPLYRLEVPRIYERLRERDGESPATLCELPLGIRDGFGETGFLDHSVLFFQTVHGHPLVGGFVARLSPRVRTFYESDAALGPLLRLSSADARGRRRLDANAPVRIEEGLRRLGVGYVMLNRATAAPDLVQLVEHMPGLKRLAQDGPRDLYQVPGVVF